ncbi:MAG: Na+/H+ antiporter NhaA [Candidatus Comchoanobacterales bacterium]
MDQTTTRTQSIGSYLLLLSTIIALVMFNSPMHDAFDHLIHLSFDASALGITKKMSLHHWVSDGLMAIFFWFVTIEIKYEMKHGSMANGSAIILPLIGAVGGMLCPAAIYLLFNPTGIHSVGWGIPMATDIAFSLALLSALVSRQRKGIFTFLLALAVFDDVGAIAVIALYYTKDLSHIMLGLSCLITSVMLMMSTTRMNSLFVYYVLGILLWTCLLESGIHATIAGVITGMIIPQPKDQPIFIKLMKHVSYMMPAIYLFILPVFALFNAGVDLRSFQFEDIFNPILMGITLGLVIGKPVGIAGLIGLARWLKLVVLPKSLPMSDIIAVSFICGIGFTMSLFIGDLAFDVEHQLSNFVRMGVILGSLVSAFFSFIILKSYQKRKPL